MRGISSGGAAGRRETSQDGYELPFAVNYLAGFLLARLLLPLMMAGKPARIVNVSSLGQHPLDFDDVMLTHGYIGGRAYAQSKLAQIMFTFDLARELDPANITANCLHPATYGDNDGAAEWGHADQQCGRRSRGDPQSCCVKGTRWSFWRVLQRAKTVEGNRPSV